MTAFLIILLIISISWLGRNHISYQTSKSQFNNRIYEDNNYQSLKKLFFAVNANNINSNFLKNSSNVFGILIEACLEDNKKVLFASYITGFTGYYQSKGGGIIGGKWYEENDQNVLQELMQLCNIKNLNGERQRVETRNMAIKLTIKANDFLNQSERYANSSESISTIKFWFLTKEGEYFVEVENSLLNNSNLKELVNKGYEIISELHKI